MRLLHVMAEMDPKKGGVGQAVRTMMIGLTEAGVHNEAATLDPPEALFLADYPLPVHALGPCKGPWNYSSELFPWLTNNLGLYDAIIVHGLWLYHGYAVRKAVRRLKLPSKTDNRLNRVPDVYVMPHGMLDPYFQKAAGRKLKAARNWLYWKLIESKLVNESNGLLFTCLEEQRLATIPFKPYKPKSETVVGLGVEEPPEYISAMKEAFASACPGLKHTTYILFLGRIDQKKGVDLLVEAYINQEKNCKELVSDSLPALVIAGPGLETEYGQKIKEFANGYSKIFFPGMLVSDAKWGAFYGCEAFILPSHQENFGIAVVEALACGKPVLISSQVNIWQEIKASGAALVESDTLDGTFQLLQSWGALPEDKKQKMKEDAITCFKKYYAMKPASVKLKEAVIPRNLNAINA